MEEDPQLLAESIVNNIEEEDFGDEEFYEKIEAPKFVDLTSPDPYRPDDRYWFCSRVGCDQKHEEEMDPEAIYKDFVLRVMAARSPNIRLRKALNGINSSAHVKCPRSAPAKSSKSRISRLAMVTSISQKLVVPKEKVRPLLKLSSTPLAKSKPVAAKYMSTPRNKRCLPNANSSRSVPNPKPTALAVPKNRMVAMALVFHSPKKALRVKTLIELRTPLTKICEGMKRLEITSQKKRVLGYSSKSSKQTARNSTKQLPIGPSRKQLSAQNGKSKAKDCSQPPNCNDLKEKSLRRMKKCKSKGDLKQEGHSKEILKNDSSDMEIDVKSRESLVDKRTGHEELLATMKISENSNSTDSTKQGNSCSDEIEGEDMKARSENHGSSENHPSVCQILEGAGHKSEVMDDDDKENEASENYREFNHNDHQPGRKVIGRQETHKVNKKAAQTLLDKNFKDGLTSKAPGAPEVKYRKPKPTNPKPFRLRTDERGILKEANLERKNRFHSQKEPATISKFPGHSQRRHGDDTQRNEMCSEETKCNNDVLKGSSEKESEKKAPNAELKPNREASIKTSSGNIIQKPFKSLHRKPNSMASSILDYSKGNASQKSSNRSRQMKLPLQRQLARPQGRAIASSHMKNGQQLSAIKETSSKVTKLIGARKPTECDATAAGKTTGLRSSSQVRRPVTVTRKPARHSQHPCTTEVPITA